MTPSIIATAASGQSGLLIGLSAVIVSVSASDTGLPSPRAFIVRGAEHALSVGVVPTNEEGDALPFGPFDPDMDETLEQSLRGWVESQTPVTPGYVEQLYTFGNKGRYMAAPKSKGQRIISIGYLALTTPVKTKDTDKVFWGEWYSYFPWEDWRQGRPRAIDDTLLPALNRWVAAADGNERVQRQVRIDLCFSLENWDEEKVLERYELLYEARLVYEAIRDKGLKVDYVLAPGRSMLYDHRRILATAMSRLRGKLKYRPVVFELMPAEFTLLQLQRTVEAIMGHALHKQNFRRLVESSGMLEEVKGKKSAAAGGRPAALFRFANRS